MNKKGLEIIEKKVEDFERNEKLYLSKSFQETEARNRFIDPFFQALGWEFDQTHIQRNQWDVHREFSQRDNSTTKKPDYAFRLNGKLKFFVEAKAPWVPLTDKDPVFQAKRYAYSTRGTAPIVIITDFQEFRVFNALEKPIYDNPSQGLLKDFDLKYTDYVTKWNLLYENFSKEAVLAGSLEKLRGKISKSTKTLDDEFLDEISSWREKLALNIARRNLSLSVSEINEAVQRILDRLVFVRQLEDRNIVDENTLFNLVQQKKDIYISILPFFGELNAKYNGLLFKPHFSEKLFIDDKTIKEIVLDLCYPRSPFQFDIIEPEILGRIYERFLGSKIRLTEGHQAKVEVKPEVIHAKGVYYTPEFIVNKIVEETVGKAVKNKKPDEISKIKILDPACGSGSFLLGAYQYLMEIHKEFYKKEKTKKYKEDYYISAEGEVKLSVKKKGEILVNNIFGVDVDREATEVAILSLYLKLLEEGLEDDTFLFLKGKVLPDMSRNIKCGNSLISREDLYSNNMFDFSQGSAEVLVHSTTTEILPFDWEREYPFNGFDCVIGNPPYIRIQELQLWDPKAVEIYKKSYKSGNKGNFDIYVLFIEKSLNLLNDRGYVGFILPNKFLNATYGENIRGIISANQNVKKIVHFGDIQIFDGPTTYTCLLFLTKSSNKEVHISKVLSLDKWKINEEAENGLISADKLTSSDWNLNIGKSSKLFEQLSKYPTKLKDIAHLFVGLQTDGDDIFIVEELKKEKNLVKCFSKATNKEHWFENDHLKYLVKGSINIKPFSFTDLSKRLIFPYITTNDKSIIISQEDYRNNFPLTWEYLESNKKALSARNKNQMGNLWYGYVYKKNHTRFDQCKILVPSISSRASYAYDEDGSYYFVGSGGGGGGGYGITINKDIPISYEYLLGILNSEFLDSYLQSYSSNFKGGFFAYNRQYIEKLPIYVPNAADGEKFLIAKKIEELAIQITKLKKVNKHSDADFLESKINELVPQLYQNQKEEAKISRT